MALIIQNGLIVDGSGKPGFYGDVVVEGDKIVEVTGNGERNRPLRGFATHGEANTPSEASAEGTGASLERLLRATARHHDMICVPVSDPAEGELPDVGLVELEDSETGELMLVDTSSAKVRKAFAEKAESDREELTKFFRKTGIDTLDIATDRPYIDGVRALFKRRARKR